MGPTCRGFKRQKMDHLVGMINTGHWSPDLDNAANKRFVADFRKKYRNEYPAHYAAQAYDSLMMIAAAVEQSGGDPKNVDAVRSAMEQAKFASVRGPFKFGKNHFPIQNFYSRKSLRIRTNLMLNKRETVLKNHAPAMSVSVSYRTDGLSILWIGALRRPFSWYHRLQNISKN